MRARLLKNPKFMIGSLFILGLFVSSVAYYLIKDDVIPVIGILHDENGKLFPHPYSPVVYPPFGTEHFGRDIFIIMLVGAKYTLGIAFFSAFLRLFISSTIGIFLGMYLSKTKKWIASAVDAFNYFPATLLAYFLLIWVLFMDRFFSNDFTYSYGFWEQVLMTVVVLTTIAIPTNTTVILNETDRFMKKEFMEGVNVLGASKGHIFKKHLLPYLFPQLFMIYLRELIQVLLIMAHLGILRIIVGGIDFKEDMFKMNREYSLSNEWSGLLGIWWEFIWTGYPWITFIPVLFFTITILAGKMTLTGFENELNHNQFPKKKSRKIKTKLPTPIKKDADFSQLSSK